MRKIKFEHDDIIYFDDMLHTIILQLDNGSITMRFGCFAPALEDSQCRWYPDEPGDEPKMHDSCYLRDWVEASGGGPMEYYCGPPQDITRFMAWRIVWSGNEDGPMWRLLLHGNDEGVEVVK